MHVLTSALTIAVRTRLRSQAIVNTCIVCVCVCVCIRMYICVCMYTKKYVDTRDTGCGSTAYVEDLQPHYRLNTSSNPTNAPDLHTWTLAHRGPRSRPSP